MSSIYKRNILFKNTTIEYFKNTKLLKFVMYLKVLFIEKAKYYISKVQKISYENRMRHHLIFPYSYQRKVRDSIYFITTQ